MNWQTAIVRRAPSLPARFLADRIRRARRPLDYGCGRGFDAAYYKMAHYDPHFYPTRPKGKFDLIAVTYVLNVVSKREETKIIRDVRRLLTKSGKVYFTVRREPTSAKRQRDVRLNLPIIYEKARRFCIYELKGT